MTTTQNAPVPATASVNNPISQVKIGDFGNGRYSPLQGEIFKDVKDFFGLSEKAADKVARRCARDFGDVMANHTTIGLAQVKTGKINKDGKLTIGEAASKVKNVTQTYGILVIRMLNYINDSDMFGIDNNRNKGTKWQPVQQLTEWFAKLELEQ